MRILKILLSFVLLAATGAFASEGDANPDNSWLKQAAVSPSAPAPVAAAGQSKAVNGNTRAVTP